MSKVGIVMLFTGPAIENYSLNQFVGNPEKNCFVQMDVGPSFLVGWGSKALVFGVVCNIPVQSKS